MRTLLRGPLHGAGASDAVLVEGEVITWVGQGRPPQRPDEEVIAGPGELIAPDFPGDRLVVPEHVTFQAPDRVTVHGQLFLPRGGPAR